MTIPADRDAPAANPNSRERGANVTRLEAFVDAAFAFAVTLLVISVDSIPESIPDLIEALKGIPAFAASFALITLFWHQHASWSRTYGLDDRRTTVLSLLLVFLVLVYVYPLRMLFGSLFAWITSGWLPAGFALSSLSDLRWMFGIYGVAWSTLGLVIVGLNRHAWSQRIALALSRDERIALRGDIAHAWMAPITGILSLLLVVALPLSNNPWLIGLPGFVYCLMGFGHLLAARVRRRAAISEPQ